MKRNGFTFMEVLVAIVAIGMVVTGLGATVAATLRHPVLGREITQATFVAQTIMDEIIADRRRLRPPDPDLDPSYQTGFARITEGFPPGFPTVLVRPSVTIDGADFVPTVTITEPIPDDVDGCPKAASLGDCRLVALTVAAPSGAVIRATILFVKYEDE